MAADDAKAVLRTARELRLTVLDEPAAKRILRSFGIATPKGCVLQSVEDLHGLGALRPPYVLKAVSPEIVHKSDVGAVRLGIRDAREVEQVLTEMRDLLAAQSLRVPGWLVEEMAPSGVECVVGGMIDSEFGPMVMVGIGGVFVELMRDVSFRICPIDRRDALEMLKELRGAPLLRGARGRPPVAVDSLVDALLAIGGDSRLLISLAGEVSEVDVNPLVVTTESAIAVDARIVLGTASSRAANSWNGSSKRSDAMSAVETFAPMFEPAAIAVVGASATSQAAGNRFIRYLQAFGYDGKIFPIHPSATELEGLPAYASVESISTPIDYAYVAVAASLVSPLIRSFAGRVRVAQVMSSGFAETVGGQELERELVQAAREANVRIVGPNCLGVYSPRGRVTFTERTSTESGSVGIVCQSGGLGIDIIRRGQNRGLRFSGLVTVGNCADVQPSELVEYFLESSETSVIGLYLEGVGDGRRLFEVLRAAGSKKPVVLLKGGLTRQGQRAAVSHTGALAGSDEGWKALAAQTGVVLVENLNSYLDSLMAFQCLELRSSPTRQAVLFGNGGGTSVLGTDALGRAGFEVGAFGSQALAALEALNLPAGSSVLNPIDVPAGALRQDEGRVAERIITVVRDLGAADVLFMHVNMTAVISYRHIDILGNLIEAALRVKAHGDNSMHFVLVLRSDGDRDTEERKKVYVQRAVAAGIPVFDELTPAANALSTVRYVEEFRSRLNNARSAV